ncbi:MAG: pentapeptide repeat-containing protein [bacterium]
MGWFRFSNWSFLILIAGLPVFAHAEWPAPTGYVSDPRYAGYDLLTPAVLQTLREKDQFFITFAGTPGCGVANTVAADLLAYQKTQIPEIPVFIVDSMSAEAVRRVAKPSGSVPLILIFGGKKLLDGQLGLGGSKNGGFFDAMMERQGLPISGLGEDSGEGNLYWRKNWKNGPPKEFGKTFRSKTLAEVDLSHADLTGAIFTYSVITHSNFRNAVLKDGKFEDTVWINTICPDGSNSDEHQYSCVGF